MKDSGGEKIEKKMSENIRWQKYGTEEQRSVADVLDSMLATFAVFHWERSELNTDALENAVEVKAMVDPIQNKSRRRRTKKWGRVRRQNSKRKKQGIEAQKSTVDVLNSMCATFAVFHLERSELNLDAL